MRLKRDVAKGVCREDDVIVLTLQEPKRMLALQWIPLFSTLSLGVGFIFVAYYFAALFV
jgi:hypothetical protein